MLSGTIHLKSIPEQFFQGVTRGLFALVRARRLKLAADHFKPFAIIGHVLVEDRFRPAVLALLRHTRVVMIAIQTYFQVRAALVAGLASAWLPRQSEFPTAFITMTSEHGSI